MANYTPIIPAEGDTWQCFETGQHFKLINGRWCEIEPPPTPCLVTGCEHHNDRAGVWVQICPNHLKTMNRPAKAQVDDLLIYCAMRLKAILGGAN